MRRRDEGGQARGLVGRLRYGCISQEPPVTRRKVSSGQQQIGTFATWREGMNPEQLAVIDHGAGPISVQAVAGCGKTRALVHRIARLVDECGIDGDRICAVTFSVEAAGVMNARLKNLGIKSARVGTWHSLALQILREDATPYATWKIDNNDRARTIVKRVLDYEYLDWEDADLREVRSFIAICKANLWMPDDSATKVYAETSFGPDARLAIDAYKISQNLIEREELLTYDDFLVYTARHLSKDQHRQRWAARWDYLFVDEFQDNSPAQIVIGDALASVHKNYCAIGDANQALYSFRGASPRYLVDFAKKHHAVRIAMVRNYRSGRRIIDVANAIIRPAKPGMAEEMIAERGVDGEVRVLRADDCEDEGNRVAVWAQSYMAAGKDLAELAVLYRLNAQSRAIEESFLKAKIPYRILGGKTFYDRKEVRDLLAYLRLSVGREGPGDDPGDALRRCINMPFRYLGKAFVRRVTETADGRVNWIGIVQEVAEQEGVNQRQRKSATEWAGVMERAIRMASDGDAPAEVLNWIVDKTRYIDAVEKEEGEESIETSGGANVREMIRVAGNFASVDQLLDFVDKTIAEAARQRRQKAKNNRVLLCSIHRSKGKEFPSVWIVGCNDGTLPHGKGDPDEERRIAYVATTRAMDSLTFSYSARYTTKHSVAMGAPSRFLVEAKLVESPSIQTFGNEVLTRA